MKEETLSNDTIIAAILYNDISIALEKRSILSHKSRPGDNPNKDSEKLSNNSAGIFKSIITSAIETIRSRRKGPDIDIMYVHISKSEATNIDCDFIASVLNDLEKQSEIFKKPITQDLDSSILTTPNLIMNPTNFRNNLNLI